MATGDRGVRSTDLQTLFRIGTVSDHADGRLLERFADHRDEDAFEVLVARHGPMVLRVCRAALADSHDVDDAFQAVFLVLARRASSVRSRESVASWLFGVATRVAARTRVDSARRRKYERLAAELRPSIVATPPDEPVPLLVEELNKLPGRYRDVLVLYYFEGQSCDAAASRLQQPVGTVKSHLARGRSLLQQRLVRRGIALPAVLIATGIPAEGAPFLPSELLRITASSASRYVAGVALPSASAVSLAEGVLKSMLLNKTGLISCITAGLATGILVVTHGQSVETPRPQPTATRAAAPPATPAARAALAKAISGDPASDPYEMTFALIGLARAQNNAGDHANALATFRQADRVAGKVANEHLRRLALMRTAVARASIGDVEPAKTTLDHFFREASGLKGEARQNLMSMVIDFQFDAGFKEEAKSNLKAELEVVDAIADEKARDGGIYRLLNNQVHLGDFEGALSQAERYTGEKSNYRASLIGVLLNVNLFRGKPPALQTVRRALDLAREITYPYPRGMAESSIAVALAHVGDIEGGLAVARNIDKEGSGPFDIRSHEVPSALVDIAKVQAKAGQSGAAKATLNEALAIVQTMTQKDVIYADRVRTVVGVQAELGDLEGAKRSALFLANDPVEKATALVAIARAQTKAGDIASAQLSLKEANEVAQGIQTSQSRKSLIGDNPTENANRIFREIAVAQAETGDAKNALAIVDGHGNDDWKSTALAAIAPVQARSGDIEGALATAKSIPKAASVYAAIGRIQAKSGDADGALAWASRLEGAAKDFALIGINEGIALRQAEKHPKDPGTP